MIRRKNFYAAKPSVSRKEINLLADELTLHTDFVLSGGKLKKGFAVLKEDIYRYAPANSIFAHYSDAMKHFGVMGKNTLYVCGPDAAFAAKFGLFTEHAFAVEDYYNDKRAIIFFCGAKRLIYSDAKYVTQSNKTDFCCGVMHCGRLFAVRADDGFCLYWSAGGALDWTAGIDGGGHIDLSAQGGEVVAITEYKSKLVLIRKNAVTVVDAFGEAQHFSVRPTETYLTTEEIIPRTCAVCGGKIYFFTSAGMRCFDGNSIETPENGAYGRYTTPIFGAGLGGKYYFKCRLKAPDRNVICVYDCADGSSEFVYQDATSFAVADAVYPVWGTSVLKLYGTSEETAQWHSRETDFGTRNLKCLTEVYADCADDAEITVKSELGSCKLYGAGRHNPHLAGRKFSFSVASAQGVNALKAAAEEVV